MAGSRWLNKLVFSLSVVHSRSTNNSQTPQLGVLKIFGLQVWGTSFTILAAKEGGVVKCAEVQSPPPPKQVGASFTSMVMQQWLNAKPAVCHVGSTGHPRHNPQDPPIVAAAPKVRRISPSGSSRRSTAPATRPRPSSRMGSTRATTATAASGSRAPTLIPGSSCHCPVRRCGCVGRADFMAHGL